MGRHIARNGELRNASKFWPENFKGQDFSEDVGVDGMIKLECILGKWVGKE
jgi:hypothetical protein